MNNTPLRILHVEDNPDHAHLVHRTLARHPVASEIRLVEDGEAALDYLFRRGRYDDPDESPRPHVILLDLRVPKIDGLEVLRVVKSNDRLLNIPIVILTSSEAEKDVALAYGLHANSYLVKPVGFDKFNEMLEQLGFYWLGWNYYASEVAAN
ncbi:MAG: response regulator [Pirellulales bacterium]|nr:response regulator [Pirellulales bacterium]